MALTSSRVELWQLLISLQDLVHVHPHDVNDLKQRDQEFKVKRVDNFTLRLDQTTPYAYLLL